MITLRTILNFPEGSSKNIPPPHILLLDSGGFSMAEWVPRDYLISPQCPTTPRKQRKHWQDAQNSGRKCNILAAQPREAPHSKGVEQCWKANGPEKTSSQTTTFLRAWTRSSHLILPSPSTVPDAEKKCSEVRRDMNTVTFLQSNGGDDMEDWSDLGDLRKPELVQRKWGWRAGSRWEKAWWSPASSCFQGPCSPLCLPSMALFSQPREGKGANWVTDPPKSPSEWKSLSRVRLCDPMDCPWNFPSQILEWVTFPFSRGSSQPRNWTRSPALQAHSLPTELSGEPAKEPKDSK